MVRPREEIQADRFSSFLLLPARSVTAVWRREHGDDRPLVLSEQREDRFVLDIAARRKGVAVSTGRGGARSLEEDVFAELAQPIARRLHTSVHAARIRLEGLGLLQRQSPENLDLFVAG